MYRIAIDDNLLIMQTGLLIESPWGYRILHLPTLATVKSETGLTADYKVIPVDRATFESFIDETLILEIIDGSSNLIEFDLFSISGVYTKFDELKVIVGLLGENLKKTTNLSTDHQDGQEKHATIETFTDSTLTVVRDSFEKNTSYIEDFIPDARFQIQSIEQEES